MRCPNCGSRLVEQPKSYSCKCGFVIWKEMSGKKITPAIAEELCNKGQTAVIDGFTSKNGRPFSAALIVEKDRVKFKFPERSEKKGTGGGDSDAEGKNIIRIRVQAGNTGCVYLRLAGEIDFGAEISYGLVSARMAEALGCITAANLIRYRIKDAQSIGLEFSLNSLDFSRYLLRERVPRDKEMKAVLERLWELLRVFGTWRAEYRKEKWLRLSGSPYADKFPVGIFPGLEAKITRLDGVISVELLPDSPDVRAQFEASIRKALPGADGVYNLPASAGPALEAWLNSVRKGERGRGGRPFQI